MSNPVCWQAWQDYLSSHSCILHRIVVPEDYAQISRNTGQTPSSAPVFLWPSASRNHCTVEPGCSDRLQSIPDHRGVECDWIECRVTYNHHPFQQTTQLHSDLR